MLTEDLHALILLFTSYRFSELEYTPTDYEAIKSRLDVLTERMITSLDFSTVDTVLRKYDAMREEANTSRYLHTSIPVRTHPMSTGRRHMWQKHRA